MRYFTFQHAIDGHPFDWPRVQSVHPHQIAHGMSEQAARERYPHAMSVYYIDNEGWDICAPIDEWPPLPDYEREDLYARAPRHHYHLPPAPTAQAAQASQ